MSRKVLGFVPIYEIAEGALATAAFVMCAECHSPIRSMGGPFAEALCIDCTENTIKEINDGVHDERPTQN